MRQPPPASNVRHQSRMRMMKKRDLNHPSSTVNLEYCTHGSQFRKVSVITAAPAQITYEEKVSIVTMIIDKIHLREIDCKACELENKRAWKHVRTYLVLPSCVRYA
jgi:hypothetical protein